jgi:C-terminal processing protease CtpA/Prc
MKKSFFTFTILFFTAFSTFGQMPNTLTPAEKVYGLSKFWQEVNYNFVYLNKIDRTLWDNRYKELISIVQNTKNDYEYYRELQKFCALLKDGHTNIFLPENIEEMLSMFGEYRIFTKNIDGKAIIILTNFSKKDEIPVGSEIIEVNGKTTQQYINENVAPYISASTDYILKDICVSWLLLGQKGDSYKIKIKKPNAEVIDLTLVHEETKEEAIYPNYDFEKKLLDFKWMKNQTAYVALNSFQDQKIDSLFIEKLPELYKAKSLIIDLRNNGGGNSKFAAEIVKYISTDTIIKGAKSRTRIHRSAYKSWGKYIAVNDTISDKESIKYFLDFNDLSYEDLATESYEVSSNLKKVIVPTVILIGYNTGSAAEDFLIFVNNQKHIVKIGENTFGSTGSPYHFDLPGGGSARICSKQDTYPDGTEFVGYGIKPDIEVKSNLSDYLNKKDPVLEKAIEYLQKQ